MARGVVRDAAGENRLDAQWQCIRRGLTDKRHGEYLDLLRRIAEVAIRSDLGELSNAKPGEGRFSFLTPKTQFLCWQRVFVQSASLQERRTGRRLRVAWELT
jgi:hypothetical protein